MLIGQRYQVMSLLGAGGMGGVYRALDRLTGQEVALKQVQLGPDGKSRAGGGRKDAQPNSNTALRTFRLALAHEFRTLATLRHPNIVGVLDYGFDAAREPFFTMQLLRQPSDLLTAARGAELPDKLSLLAQLLRALVYLHRHNIIHRDLKPRKVARKRDCTANDPPRLAGLADQGLGGGSIFGARDGRSGAKRG